MTSKSTVVSAAPVLKFPIPLKTSSKTISGVKKQTKPKHDLATIHEWAQSLTGQFDFHDQVVGVAPLRLILAAPFTARSEFLTTNEDPSVCTNHHALGNAFVELVDYLKST
ncbi:hypothetical protein PSPO01_09036 [Paraphaeosphaeria sporulosa]